MIILGIMFLYGCSFSCVCGLFEILSNPGFSVTVMTSGVAVTDVDGDGEFEIIVAVSNGPNRILMYDRRQEKYSSLSAVLDTDSFKLLEDPEGQTVSICACDVTGDGIEEVYLHNSNDVYRHLYDDKISGQHRAPDRLITRRPSGDYVDLFALPENKDKAPTLGGFSAACIDSDGDGSYEIVVSTYKKDGRGTFKHISVEGSTTIIVKEIMDSSNKSISRVGRGLLVGPLTDDGIGSDVFILSDNSFLAGSTVYRHNGSNVLLRNNGDSTFTNNVQDHGLEDADNNGRTAALVDINNDGILDIVFANWLGPSRAYLGTGNNSYRETLDPVLVQTTATEVLILQDFDNDGNVDLFKTNVEESHSTHSENLMLTVYGESDQLIITKREIQDETLKKLRITGGAVADLDGDGHLELYASHTTYNNLTFSVFRMKPRSNADWIRVLPLTKQGSPARGALVTVTLSNGKVKTVVIGGDCSYMCQSEPMAHIGLGKLKPTVVTVVWPDGHTISKFLYNSDRRVTLKIHYNGVTDYLYFERKKFTDFTFSNVYTSSNLKHVPCLLLTLFATPTINVLFS